VEDDRQHGREWRTRNLSRLREHARDGSTPGADPSCRKGLHCVSAGKLSGLTVQLRVERSERASRRAAAAL
jgi:hypothetical protein